MPSYRNLFFGSGVVLGVAALALSGSVASYGSTAPTTATSAAGSVSQAGPDPSAPHVGFVHGVQRGPNIAIRNEQAVHAFRVLHRGLISGSASGPAETIHTNVGTSFNPDASFLGSQARQSVSRKIHAGPHTPALYTPTTYPSGTAQGSCIEVSTAYFPGSSVVAAWDWCVAINFVASVDINRSFMKTYTKHRHYSTQIVQTSVGNNTWTAYLFNYQSGHWERFFQQHGTSQISGSTPGWDVYELYSEIKGNGQSYACSDLRGKTVDADKILLDLGGNWVPADPNNSGHAYDQPLSSFDCRDIAYTIDSPNDHFHVDG